MNKNTEMKETEEMSLIDIVRMLINYKKTFISVFIVVFLLMVAVLHYRGHHQNKQGLYTYTQPLYLSYYVENGLKQNFEKNTDISSQLQAIVPSVLATQHVNFEYTYGIGATGAVYLMTMGTPEQASAIAEVNQTILREVAKMEAPLLAYQKQFTLAQIKILKSQIASSQNNSAVSIMVTQNNNVTVLSPGLALANEQEKLASISGPTLGEMYTIKTSTTSSLSLPLKAALAGFVAFFVALFTVFGLRFVINLRNELLKNKVDL
jgi:hypothetical protein